MDFMKLKATLSLDDTEYRSGLDEAEGKAKGLGGKVKSAMAVGAAAVGAATAAVGALVKKSVSSYADYEQMVGGVKKLYGNMGMSLEDYAASVGKSTNEVQAEYAQLEKSQNLVLQNAQQAFKTTGMSANEYMETATSFSASLINSLGGDTVKAAEQTDVAMKAIADNFNTFGGDIGMIQGAFQGFAKQNYTMLDNLKLGYGGTKQEMERLIADANEWGKANGKASDLSIDSFSDVVTAIDYIQQKQHIAGTTAREASTTIAGSFMTLKAAWENLVTGFADPEADIGMLLQNVMESVGTVATNLAPAIMQALESIGEVFTTALPQLIDKIPEAMSNMAPLVKTGAKMVMSLIDGIASSAPRLIASATDLIGKMLIGIAQQIPNLITSGLNLITGLIEGLGQGGESLLSMVSEIVGTLVQAFIDAAPEMGEAALNLIDALINVFLETDWVGLGMRALRGILNGVKATIPLIRTAISSLVHYILEKMGFPGLVAKVRSVFENIRSAISEKIESARRTVSSVIETIKSYFPFNVGKIFTGWIPKIKLWTKKDKDSASTSSSVGSEHFAKAMNQPYVFTEPTIFNQVAGDAGDEMLYGKSALMRDMAEVVENSDRSGGTTVYMTNYITVDGAENPEQFANRFVRGVQMKLRAT